MFSEIGEERRPVAAGDGDVTESGRDGMSKAVKVALTGIGVATAAATVILTVGAGDGGDASSALAELPPEAREVTVYKTPSCGCCSLWAEHLAEAGFRVRVEERVELIPVKREHGVPLDLASCHTAVVDGYVLEGHVPAADVTRLLSERPDVEGLAVPGMPMGSPGMEGPRKDDYEVIAFDADGNREVFARH